MKKLIFLLVLLTTASYGADYHSPYDPGAARDSLSNVTPATGRAALGLGTMAVATSTDYVATDTFTGHTDATGASVHGLGTISTKAATDYVATSSLAERLDTGNASFSENIDVAGNVGAATLNNMTPGTIITEDASKLEAYNQFNPRRWGFKINLDEPDPYTSVTYLYDAAGYSPATFTFNESGAMDVRNYGDWWPFINAICRPVMLNPDGSVAYELDHTDQTKKLDGTPSDINSTTHAMNAMVEFKRLWKKIETVGNETFIIFSNVQYDPDYEAYAFTNADGEVQEQFYYSMFEGSNVSSKLRSLATGAVMTSQVGATEIDYADNNGAGWYITTYSQHNFIANLHVLISKNLDSQGSFGRGNESGAAYIAPGAMVAEGPFAGYNTTDSTKAVKTFYIEHFWANYWKRCAGLLLRNDAGTAKIYVKHTPTYNETADGYIDTGVTPGGTSGQYIKAMNAANDALIPSTNTGGSASTFFMDGFWFATPAAAGACHYARVGAYRDSAGMCGAFTVALHYPLSTAYSHFGARLSFLK